MIALRPTIAWERGDSIVVQCSYCGTLIAVPWAGHSCEAWFKRGQRRFGLGPCPSCGREDDLWEQSLPVGPLTEETA